MEVILKEDINNLGNLGEVVSVKPGYARNYLVPNGKAAFATKENLKLLEQQKEELKRKQEEELIVTKELASKYENLSLTIEANVTEEGNLYGSIGTIDIVNAAKEKGFELERSLIDLPDGPIKTIGDHEVNLIFHGEIQVKIRVQVVGGEVAIKNTLDSEEEDDNIDDPTKENEIIEESELMAKAAESKQKIESLGQLSLPPHSSDAEAALIGGLLLDPDNQAYDKIADILSDRDFYHPENKQVFTTIQLLIEQSKVADLLTASDYLDSGSDFAEKSSINYLSDVVENTAGSSNIIEYA